MKRIVILGGGESGVGAAVLAKARGFDTFLTDTGTIAPKYAEELRAHDIPYEQGGPHTRELVLNADEVIKSPGVPPTAPIVRDIVAKGIPVISEIEFAGRYTDAKMICITGSNGKTTTTMLLYHILKSAGLNVGLAGNVGKSLALQVAGEKHDYYVIELSSFQLENMYEFKADIAILLNITPDHMDRYDHKMENYVAAKFRIMQNMGPRDSFIYWQDDPVVTAQARHPAPGVPDASLRREQGGRTGRVAPGRRHEHRHTVPARRQLHQGRAVEHTPRRAVAQGSAQPVQLHGGLRGLLHARHRP